MGKYTFLFNGKCWFLEIKDLDTLNAYHKMIWGIRMKDFQRDIYCQAIGRHPSSDMGSVCQALGNVKGISAFRAFQELEETQHKQMSRQVIEGNTLYVNPAGGYSVVLEDITNRLSSDDMQWPVLREGDIRIKQWPDGTHYYAYIGPVQVKDGGRCKWDSESDARTAAMAYVTTRQKSRVR